jgi:hypothetical protein
VIEAEVRGVGYSYTVRPLPRRRSRWVLAPLTLVILGGPWLLAAVLIFGVF